MVYNAEKIIHNKIKAGNKLDIGLTPNHQLMQYE